MLLFISVPFQAAVRLQEKDFVKLENWLAERQLVRRKEERGLRCEPIGLSAPLPAGLTGGSH